MSVMRPILITGGAPRVVIDRVRYLSATASGHTALVLRSLLHDSGIASDLLLSLDVEASAEARRYRDRPELDEQIGAWITEHPNGVVVMSAAVNDYQLDYVERIADGRSTSYSVDEKIPSGGEGLLIHFKPAEKLIDQLRPRWGLMGPIVGFKYEEKETVEAEAERLRQRVGAALVVANSTCGTVQALVDARGSHRVGDRKHLLQRLSARVRELALT